MHIDTVDTSALYPTEARLSSVFESVATQSVGVVGDFCLDQYLFIDRANAERSVETGRETSPVSRLRVTPGGAGNLAANLASLGFQRVAAYGVLGPDLCGDEQRRLLESAGVDTTGLVVQPDDWTTQTYMKVIEAGNERDRFDFGIENRLSHTAATQLLRTLASDMAELDAIVINQQLTTGLHTEWFRASLAGLLSELSACLVIVDSRDYADEFGGSVVKVNEYEAARYCGEHRSRDDRICLEDAAAFADRLATQWNREVVVTLGANGSLVAAGGRILHQPGVHHIEEIDTVGAGDAMLAGLCTALVAGMEAPPAAVLGNLVAGVTVTKLFCTGIASVCEVMSLACDPDYRYHQATVEQLGGTLFPDGAVQVITATHAGRVRFAVFDHDGTISTVREGWEPVMHRTMVRAILGPAIDDSVAAVDRRTMEEIDTTCWDFIQATTGVRTIVQMEGLRRLVSRYGFVDKRDILSAHDYKTLYNQELMRVVDARLESLSSGARSAAEYTLLGAVTFLQRLVDIGVVLFLASGTDVGDVRREATTLGYADLFGDRIFGATAQAEVEPKKEALRHILSEVSGETGGFVMFGDGPVEMREAKKSGGLAVGIMSDEVRRYGWNYRKRDRLIRGGADVLISDFACHEQLFRRLGLDNSGRG